MKSAKIPLISLITACSTIPQFGTDSAGAVVRSSLRFSVDGVVYEGTATVARRPGVVRQIVVDLPPGSPVAYVRTCHREDVYREPPRQLAYGYSPVLFLEAWGPCPMVISAVTEQGNLRHAIIDWTTNETLTADHYCNGRPKTAAAGSYLCESRAGLIQRVELPSRGATWAGQDGCPDLQPDGYAFAYAIGQGLCSYGIQLDGKIHRLLTRGYTEIEK